MAQAWFLTGRKGAMYPHCHVLYTSLAGPVERVCLRAGDFELFTTADC